MHKAQMRCFRPRHWPILYNFEIIVSSSLCAAKEKGGKGGHLRLVKANLCGAESKAKHFPCVALQFSFSCSHNTIATHYPSAMRE